MNTRAIRLPLALAAVALPVAVLSFLLIESRSVTDGYYLSHAERTRIIADSNEDTATVFEAAQQAYAEGGAMTAVATAALERIEAGNQSLQAVEDLPRVTPDLALKFSAYDQASREFTTRGLQFSKAQDELASRLLALQEQSPLLVRALREQDLDPLAQQTFSLAIDVIEFASGKGVRVAAPLELRSNALRADLQLSPDIAGQLTAFADLADQVLVTHAASAAALEQLSTAPVQATLSDLGNALAASNRQTVSRAERARNLLAGCAVLILLAAAYAIWRLQLSYRELNAANSELEERVLERTDLLSKAYDDLKESQVQLIHAEKMSSLGELVAGISHEINTPLWYLINNASVLQERLDVVGKLCEVNDSMLAAVRSRSSVNEAVSGGLRQLDELFSAGIRDDVEEAKSLVQDSIDGLEDLTLLAQGLKDFSRLDRAAQAEFNINEGLERTLLIAKNHVKHKANVQTQFGDLPLIECSPSQINQVFLNLITNAADAIEGRGDIVIQTATQGDRIEISIADTGCGIPKDIIGKVRDPFFTTKEVGQGTGLGLSIVDRIVAQHGGEMHIESEPGKGTTVTVYLPQAAAGQTAHSAGAHEKTSANYDLDPAAMAQSPAAYATGTTSALSA